MPSTRRQFLKNSLGTVLAATLTPRLGAAERVAARSNSNDAVQLAVIGLGGLDVVGGVGGRGRQLIDKLRQIPKFRIVALCDVDQTVLDQGVKSFKDRGETVAEYRDLRKVLEDKNIDAVAIATPNHWHALATIWACQAGKDVYVEKPFSYNIWEGEQMVAAARKYGRMVQVGTQNRSSTLLRHGFDSLRAGELGAIRCAHALVYRPRDPLGTVSSPTPVPSSVDYDLWCGPAPKTPLMRKQLHYEWHWFWPTGNGEIGNNGIHVIDISRWGLGMNQPAPRAITMAGRFGFNDCGETPNTQIAFFDFKPAPLICEVRNLRVAKGTDAAGKFRGRNGGIVIDCEGGYLAGDGSGATLFDKQGAAIKELKPDAGTDELELAHLTSFLRAIRSRKISDLAAEALEGHRSTTCCHMANVSYRLGQPSKPEAIQESFRANSELLDAFERCREHLRANNVDLGTTPAVLGPWVTFDAEKKQFVGEFAQRANALSQRQYRSPFVVPKVEA
jgi:predicted dehydrogenase